MPYLLFLKKRQILKLSSAANCNVQSHWSDSSAAIDFPIPYIHLYKLGIHTLPTGVQIGITLSLITIYTTGWSLAKLRTKSIFCNIALSHHSHQSQTNANSVCHFNTFTFLHKRLLATTIEKITCEGDSSLYSKTCVKQPLKNRQNKDINDKW